MKHLRHKWHAVIICKRCGLTPETADTYCHPGAGHNGQDAHRG